MYREDAILWAEALESGKYKQGKGRLAKNIDGETYYCCLGVRCELAGIIKKPDPDVFEILTYEGLVNYLPPHLCDNDISDAGVIRIRGLQFGLAYINDAGRTFPEIASILREWATTLSSRPR